MSTEPTGGPPTINLQQVEVVRERTRILHDVSWTVRSGQRWVILGPNGAGKTTLLRLAACYLQPTAGRAEILGHRLGQVDVRRLRRHIGLVSPALAGMLRPEITGIEVVMSGREAALETWWHSYDERDRKAAEILLDRVGARHVADRHFGNCSSGERQRILLARSLWGEPGLVLHDEPTAGLDLGAREDLLARDPATPPLVLVTHHVEEIPRGFTHALLMGGGTVAAAGPLPEVVTSEALSALFGLPLTVEQRSGRYSARMA